VRVADRKDDVGGDAALARDADRAGVSISEKALPPSREARPVLEAFEDPAPGHEERRQPSLAFRFRCQQLRHLFERVGHRRRRRVVLRLGKISARERREGPRVAGLEARRLADRLDEEPGRRRGREEGPSFLFPARRIAFLAALGLLPDGRGDAQLRCR
jgi:hypothetical protein